jgi:elongation factor Ts
VEITAQAVKALRDETNAGFMECKQALTESGGDVQQAKKWLEARGLKKAEKVTGREAKEGLVHAYIHPGGRIGSLVEISCETDFVARTEDFQKLARDISMQVAAVNPTYISLDDVPAEEQEKAKAEHGDAVNKHYAEIVLLNQPFIRDGKTTINDMLLQARAKLGENIVVRKMVRYELGK